MLQDQKENNRIRKGAALCVGFTMQPPFCQHLSHTRALPFFPGFITHEDTRQDRHGQTAFCILASPIPV